MIFKPSRLSQIRLSPLVFLNYVELERNMSDPWGPLNDFGSRSQITKIALEFGFVDVGIWVGFQSRWSCEPPY